MAFNLPKNAKEVVDRIISDVLARLPDSGSFLFVSYFKSLITGFGLRLYNVYTKIPIMLTQFYATTAQNEYLLEIGNQWGITRNPTTGSSGNIVLTGTVTTNIPIATLFNNSAGLVYETQTDGIITQSTTSIDSMSRIGTTVTVNFPVDHNLASGIVIDNITGATPTDFNATSVQITVTSKKQFTFTQAGTAGNASGTIVAQWTTTSVTVASQTQGKITNMVSGSIINLSTPILGIDNQGYVDFGELSAGTDIEDLESYRKRLLFRMRNPKTLFNNSDIISKMTSVSGVTRAWVFNPDSTVNNITPVSITWLDGVATVYKPNHGFYNGTFITVINAVESEFNLTKAQILKKDDDYFIYIVAGSPTTPATGTISISGSYVELGQVKMSFVRDNDDSQIPSGTEVNTVKDALLEIKPGFMADQDVIVFTPIAVNVDFTFTSISPNTTAMKTAIEATLKNFFKIYNNVNEDIKFSNISAVLSQVIDGGGNLLQYTLSIPTANIEIGLNQIAILGDINYS
tara:strand:- start:25799 stop:27346 length:1548 start_codon:yes stop_codon:yes gene_type:complete